MLPAKISVLGVRISRLDYTRAVDEIISAGRERRDMAVTALAVHGLMEAFMNGDLRAKINAFDIVTPDGQPVRWAQNLLGAKELKDRVCGPILTEKVCEKAAETGVPVFFYGSRAETLQKLTDNLKRRFPKLIIAGVQADRFRDATPEEDAADNKRINDSGAGITFVGRGCPRQEKWVAAHVGRAHGVLFAVGAAFDFHAGTIPRAPKILQDLGLEWVFRLMQEPKRLWRRYLILNPLYMFHFTLQWLGIKKYD